MTIIKEESELDDNKEKLAESAEEVTQEINTEETAEAAEETAEAVEEAASETAEISDETAQAIEAFEQTAEGESDEFTDSTGISDELRELQDATANMKPAKKKRKLMVPIIISLCIVIVAAAAALVLTLFFNKSIEGTWFYEQEVQTGYATSTNDEPPTMKVGYYFTFESGGKLTFRSGTISGSGTYTYRTGSVEGEPIGQPVVDMNFIDPFSGQTIEQTFKAEISGNIFSGQKLKLTSIKNTEVAIDLEKKDYKKPELKLDGDFVADKEVEGKWVTVQNSMGVKYTMTYELKSDGTVTITNEQKYSSQLSGSSKDLVYTITYEGLYSCNKGKLEIVYDMAGQQKGEIPYTVKEKGNVLTISGAQDIDYYKVGSASADEIMNPVETTAAPTEAATEKAK